jgi:hypothetical protein
MLDADEKDIAPNAAGQRQAFFLVVLRCLEAALRRSRR